MSDTSQGPGWWQAADLKWYPPELYPKEWKKPAPDAGDAPVGAAESLAQPDQPAAQPAQAVAPVTEPAQPSQPAHPAVEPAQPAAQPAQHVARVSEPAQPSQPAASATPPATVAPAAAPPTQQSDAIPPAVAAAHAAAEPAIDWSEPVAPNGAQAPVTPSEPAAAPDGPPEGWAGAAPAVPPITAETVFEPEPVTTPSTAVAPEPVVDPAAVAPVEAPGEPTPPQSPPATWDIEGAKSAAAANAATPRRTGATSPYDEPGPPDIPAGILGVLGAALLIVGSFLAWAKAGGTLTTGTVNGLSGSNGWGTLICGLVVAVGSIMVMAGRRRPWIGASMAAASAVAIGLVVFSIIDIGSTSDELPDVLREQNIVEDVAAGAKLDLSSGVWIVAVGAAIAMVAGIIALARRR